MKNIQENYKLKKKGIQQRLKEFRNLDKKLYFSEFLFCLLTPQSNAKKCWEAVEELSKLPKFTKNRVSKILSSKTRFYKTKTNYILNSTHIWHKEVKPKISKDNPVWLRNWLAKQVLGFGMKEASHFLRNIGISSNKIAILDRHILKNLKSLSIIENTKIKSQKHYLEIEQKFIETAKSLNIPPDELDLLWWSHENGEIFR